MFGNLFAHQSDTRSTFLATAGLVLLLQACAAVPLAPVPSAASQAPAEVEPSAQTEPLVTSQASAAAAQQKPEELTLNLPDPQAADWNSSGPEKTTISLLEMGFRALAAGDHREAVNYFRRYQRLEASPGVDWEAGIAVAYVKMMPQSPYYNWRAARDSYLQLMRDQPQGIQPHEQILLMKDMLPILVELHTQINDLQKETATLTESLEKREEALRRLRELTLGQKGAVQ